MAVLLLFACGSRQHKNDAPSVMAPRPATVSSNILSADYAGSKTCQGCHQEIYGKWQHSAMQNMTRSADAAEIAAPFAGEVFNFMSDRSELFRRDGVRYMRVVSQQFGNRLFRVTKVIGGHYREDFVGLEVSGTEDDARSFGDERILPVTFLKFNQSYRYKGYSVMSPERPGLKRGPAWKKTCIFCHNTTAQLSSIYDEIFGPDSPGYQGSQSIALPAEDWFTFRVTDSKQLTLALGEELDRIGATRPLPEGQAEQLKAAIVATREHYGEQQLVELGIGCEACHGGAKEHAENPALMTSFALKSSFLRVERPDGASPTRAQDINRTCAKCHTVLFSRYRYTWEGGTRYGRPGGSSMNSGEARDFMLGHCSEQLSCESCHDPHQTDARAKLSWLGTPAGNGVCTSCHEALADSRRLALHTHHASDSEGSACLNCHMVKKNVALAYRLTRYHRIGSPTDKQRVEHDRPLECALCHSDKSVLELVETMERWYRTSFDRARLQLLYGRDLRNNVLVETLRRGRAHEQVVAIALLGAAGDVRSADPQQEVTNLLVEQLGHEYPLIRFFAKQAIEQRTEKTLAVDMHLPAKKLVPNARAELSQTRKAGAPRQQEGPERLP